MHRRVDDRIARLRSTLGLAREEQGAGDAARAQRLVDGFEAQGQGWFWETDRGGHVTYLSPRIGAELGLGEGASGELLTDLFRTAGFAGGGERTLTFHLHARTGFTDLEVQSPILADRTWSVSGRPSIDERGQFRGFVGNGSDLTAKQQAEAEVTRLALYDSLTGLSNRARIQHSLDQSLAQRGGGRGRIALLMLDLDRFKSVNDTLGHQIGDELLKHVASRLKRVSATMASALVGRIGGDEFQIVIAGENSREDLAGWAQRIIATLSRPFQIRDASISIGASIGVAVAPDDGDDAETLVRNADLALYAAKGAGRGLFRFFDPALLTRAQLRKQLEDDLRGALIGHQLDIAYQPVVAADTGAISGYEALLRWAHPTRGPVSPAEFVPVAEESGLIDTIGEWVLRTACDRAARWPVPVRLAVNVSPIQFGKPALAAIVANALAASGLSPERLELEITESVFLAGNAKTEATFAALKQLGVRLALDDFGTGYSSLGYLQTAPFDKIKIDQSFVRGASSGNRDPAAGSGSRELAASSGNRNAAIIRAIVTLAEALGLETTAEGAEAQDEIELIRALGCSHIQGFVYGRPMSNDEVLAQLSGGAGIKPIGVKVSRPARVRMLRSIRIERRGRRGTARLRDLSLAGAMIDQLALAIDVGDELDLELGPGQMVPGFVRWRNGDRAGVQLLQKYDFAERDVIERRAMPR